MWRHPMFKGIARQKPSIHWILPAQRPSSSEGSIEQSRRLSSLFIQGDWEASEWDLVIDQVLALKDWRLVLPMAARSLPIQLYPRFPFDPDSLQAWESLLALIKDPASECSEFIRVILAKAMQGPREPRRAALFMRTVGAVLGCRPMRYKAVLKGLSPELAAFALTWISTAEGQSLFNALCQSSL